ncbi:MAG: thioredoxin, partial [Hyphomicrobiales bacterium]|nr:thioredoxin [Hyphomicrobiales bacterium]
LVKMNIDEHPQIAGQLGIKSIPAVVAFQNGRPVDGFVGALPESQIKGFIERLVGPVDDGVEAMIADAEAALADGNPEAAAEIFSAVLASQPEDVGALAGLSRTLVAQGLLDEAQAVLDHVPADVPSDPRIVAAKAALDLAVQAADLGDIPALERRIAQDPSDHQARFDLALALNARNRRQEAAEALLLIIKQDRSWQDDRARQQLLQLFDAWGPMDPDTAQTRRKLSTLLFS